MNPVQIAGMGGRIRLVLVAAGMLMGCRGGTSGTFQRLPDPPTHVHPFGWAYHRGVECETPSLV